MALCVLDICIIYRPGRTFLRIQPQTLLACDAGRHARKTFQRAGNRSMLFSLLQAISQLGRDARPIAISVLGVYVPCREITNTAFA